MYWTSPRGEKLVIGSNNYFLYGLRRLKEKYRDASGRIYNPYGNTYIDLNGERARQLRLEDMYQIARQVSFKLTRSGTRIHVVYPVGVAAKFSTLKFVNSLRKHNNKYRLHEVQSSFYRSIYERLMKEFENVLRLDNLELAVELKELTSTLADGR